jgi:hypothetical protein
LHDQDTFALTTQFILIRCVGAQLNVRREFTLAIGISIYVFVDSTVSTNLNVRGELFTVAITVSDFELSPIVGIWLPRHSSVTIRVSGIVLVCPTLGIQQNVRRGPFPFTIYISLTCFSLCSQLGVRGYLLTISRLSSVQQPAPRRGGLGELAFTFGYRFRFESFCVRWRIGLNLPSDTSDSDVPSKSAPGDDMQ